MVSYRVTVSSTPGQPGLGHNGSHGLGYKEAMGWTARKPLI